VPVNAARQSAVVAAAFVAGLLFAPVFGTAALVPRLGVPAVVALVVAVSCGGRLVAWRPVLTAAAGIVAVVGTSLPFGVLGPDTLRELWTGATGSWRLVLQSTWPARPDPELLLFVPLLVVAATTIGVELAHRERAPLLALAPSLAVAAFAQCYATTPPAQAAVAAFAYAAAAGVLLAARPGRLRAVLLHATAPVALAVTAAALTGLVPSAPARYALHGEPAAVTSVRVTNPLDEIAYRLAHPTTEVFRVRNAAAADRWPIAVFDAFDGIRWTSTDRYRRLGTEVGPGPAVSVPVRSATAEIDTTETLPWLPSQTWPARVRGVDPLIEERHGTLLLGEVGAARYTLTWWQPDVDAGALGDAALDPLAPGGTGGVGAVPPGIADLAAGTVHGLRPSMQAALALERFLRDNYRVLTDGSLPTGHSWPQLTDFLLNTRRGTSEQFATAYVVLARMLGIPARLAVGFRTPATRDPDGGYTVRNADALAWPEVAVRDVGWVPMEPGTTRVAGGAPVGGLAAATDRARAQLPAPEALSDPPVPPVPPADRSAGGGLPTVPMPVVLGVPVLVLLGLVLGTPMATGLRAALRRRRPGVRAVAGAVEEARDRLRAHGVAVSAGMTPRDLASVAPAGAGPGAADGLRRLGAVADRSLWSGAAPHDGGAQAWAAGAGAARVAGAGARGVRPEGAAVAALRIQR
jgi:transglutaminase-like putative cysteine protease